MARLAQLVSERQVKAGLRRTLHLQTQRLDWLSNQRLTDLSITTATPGNDDEVTDADDGAA